MRIAAYCRVSTDKEDQINSLEAQKEFFSDYAKKNNYTLVGVYADEGLSGTSTKKRIEFNRMLDDAQNGKLDMIATKEVSRFARNTVDTLSITRSLKAAGVGVLFISDNINTFDNDGELRLSIMATLAQEESRKISNRVKWGKKQAAKKGRVPNFVYGYDRIEGDNFDLLINECEAEVIRRVYDLYINSGSGAVKIANILNDDGLKTKRGCNWSQNAICRILTNPIYVGKIINGKEETENFLTGERVKTDKSEWQITYKPKLRIIEDGLFMLVQEKMDKHRTDFSCFKKRQSNRHLFSTLLKCMDCGYSYSRRTNKDTRPKWHCTSRSVRGRDFCSNRYILDEEILIDELNRDFASLITDKRAMINQLVTDFKKQYDNPKQINQSEKSLNAQLRKFDEKFERYTEMYADGIISKEQLNQKITVLKKQRNPVEARLAEFQNKTTKADYLDDVLTKTLDTIEKITDIRNSNNAQLKELIDRIEVRSDGNVDIYMKTLDALGLDETLHISDNSTNRLYNFLFFVQMFVVYFNDFIPFFCCCHG
jgi:DNA invertase Pin-like site-specific DNA recombinase